MSRCDVCDERPSVRTLVAYGIETAACAICSHALCTCCDTPAEHQCEQCGEPLCEKHAHERLDLDVPTGAFRCAVSCCRGVCGDDRCFVESHLEMWGVR